MIYIYSTSLTIESLRTKLLVALLAPWLIPCILSTICSYANKCQWGVEGVAWDYNICEKSFLFSVGTKWRANENTIPLFILVFSSNREKISVNALNLGSLLLQIKNQEALHCYLLWMAHILSLMWFHISSEDDSSIVGIKMLLSNDA